MTVDAFDADVLIYAAAPDHALGRSVRRIFAEHEPDDAPVGIGSVLLVPEILVKPLRQDRSEEVSELAQLIGRLDLRPVDEATSLLAVALGVSYGLRAADAVHLATAVAAGADRFITNNSRDFPTSISEVDITYPGDLG